MVNSQTAFLGYFAVSVPHWILKLFGENAVNQNRPRGNDEGPTFVNSTRDFKYILYMLYVAGLQLAALFPKRFEVLGFEVM